MPSPYIRSRIIDCTIHVRNQVLEIMSTCDHYKDWILSIHNYWVLGTVYIIQQVYDPLNCWPWGEKAYLPTYTHLAYLYSFWGYISGLHAIRISHSFPDFHSFAYSFWAFDQEMLIYGLFSMIIEHFCVNPTTILPHKGGNEKILWDQGINFYSLIGQICHFGVKNAWVFAQAFFPAFWDFR